MSRWESGELEPSPEIIDWLQRNRSQYFLDRGPLCALDEPRGMAERGARAEILHPLTSKVAKAAA